MAKARLLKALSEQETIPYEWITGKLGVSAATVNSIVKSGAAKMSVPKAIAIRSKCSP